MRAWWAYWISIGIAAALWTGVAVVGRDGGLRAVLDDPLWLTILLAPFVVAGVNLIVFRDSHEEVCRLEVERHPWLRSLVGSGYSARTFALTGLAVLAVVAFSVVAR